MRTGSGRCGRRGMALAEAAALAAMAGVVLAVVIPAASKARVASMAARSHANLAAIGAASASYVNDFGDLLPNYSWKGGERYRIPNGTPDGSVVLFSDDPDSQSWQNTAILRRVTGRDSGLLRIQDSSARLVHRRQTHIVLLDYLGEGMPNPVAISPLDANQQEWADNPLITAVGVPVDEFGTPNGMQIPYGNGTGALPPGYDIDIRWISSGVKQRWPFASSYHPVPAAWNPDRGRTFRPITNNSNLFAYSGVGSSAPILGGRRAGEVAHPAQKVFFFEEFDRETDAAGIWYAYDAAARVNSLFFDGSVAAKNSAEANPGWDPSSSSTLFRQIYTPIDLFPAHYQQPITFLLFPKFRWTREGLAGVDFGGAEVNLPDSVANDPLYPRP